jgi:murein DD-endopeptidase MepM/ murein hydrolase activator NlpD
MVETGGEAARGARRRLIILAGALALTVGASALAAPIVRHAAPPHQLAIRVATASQPAPSPVPLRLVWTGADVDGDGQPDFVNPTGKGLRQTDAYGYGAFDASRDGGARRHEGVDFMAEAGQPVVAPISGYVTKIGFAYPGDDTLKFVEISNPALHYEARVFYVDPKVVVGQVVRLGDVIGVHHTLEHKYPDGMTDHVHLEITDTRGAHIDATRVITAHDEPAAGPPSRSVTARS